jgi:hypothetical protein
MQVFMIQQQQYTAHQQAQIQALQATIQALQQPTKTSAFIPEPTLTDISVSALRCIKTILLDSPKFNETKSDFEKWKSLMTDKIEVNSKMIDSNRNQFIYVISRLEEKSLQLTLTFIMIYKDSFEALFAKILNYLNIIFGD